MLRFRPDVATLVAGFLRMPLLVRVMLLMRGASCAIRSWSHIVEVYVGYLRRKIDVLFDRQSTRRSAELSAARGLSLQGRGRGQLNLERRPAQAGGPDLDRAAVGRGDLLGDAQTQP